MSRIPRVLVLLMAFSAILLLVASAQAQPDKRRGKGQRPGQRRGMVMAHAGGGASHWLLRSEQVQKELELVAEQKAKLKAIAEETQAQMRELYSGIRDLKPEERRAKFAELREKSKDQAEKAAQQIKEVMLPKQRERFKQIQLQVRGVGALDDKEVSESLGITDEQKGKLKSLREGIHKKRQAAFGGYRKLSPEERQKKMAEVRKQAQKLQEEAVQQALGVLTSEQRESFEKMKGEKFELDRSKMYGQRQGGHKRGPGDRPGKKRPGGRRDKKGPPKDKPSKEEGK